MDFLTQNFTVKTLDSCESRYEGKYKGYQIVVFDWTCTPHGGWWMYVDEMSFELSSKEDVEFILSNLCDK